MPTLRDLLTDAYYETTIYSPGQVIGAEHIRFAGTRINNMMDSWKAERLTIYREHRTGPFALVANIDEYRIGTGATWNTARPIWIDYAGLLHTVGGPTPTQEYPLKIFTDSEWARITPKGLTSTMPTGIWYDRDFKQSSVVGSGLIHVWPVPTATNQIVLYSPVPAGEFDITPTGLAAEVMFPPGYREFLMYHLAIRLGPAFGRDPMQMTVDMAALSMGRVKDSNLRMNEMSVDNALIHRYGVSYNVYNDSFGGH
jgi:hypothetical protein